MNEILITPRNLVLKEGDNSGHRIYGHTEHSGGRTKTGRQRAGRQGAAGPRVAGPGGGAPAPRAAWEGVAWGAAQQASTQERQESDPEFRWWLSRVSKHGAHPDGGICSKIMFSVSGHI